MSIKARPYARTVIVGELTKVEYCPSASDINNGNVTEPTLARLRVKTWERKTKTDDTGKKVPYFEYSYHPVVAYSFLLERVDQFKEGDSIRVEGKPQSRTWGDPDGRGGVTYEIKADRLEFALTQAEAKVTANVNEQPIAETEKRPTRQHNSHNSARYVNQRHSYQSRSRDTRYDR